MFHPAQLKYISMKEILEGEMPIDDWRHECRVEVWNTLITLLRERTISLNTIHNLDNGYSSLAYLGADGSGRICLSMTKDGRTVVSGTFKPLDPDEYPLSCLFERA